MYLDYFYFVWRKYDNCNSITNTDIFHLFLIYVSYDLALDGNAMVETNTEINDDVEKLSFYFSTVFDNNNLEYMPVTKIKPVG